MKEIRDYTNIPDVSVLRDVAGITNNHHCVVIIAARSSGERFGNAMLKSTTSVTDVINKQSMDTNDG